MSDNCVFFWRSSRGKFPGKGCLSQWQPCSFEVDGVRYVSAEQFMMAEKARTFGDTATLDKILAAKSPQRIKALGRAVKPFDAVTWDRVKADIVVRGNLAKFGQNRELLAFLLGTGDATLVEASPDDAIWGVGLKENDHDILDPGKWKGGNLLGKALMTVRDRLAKEADAQTIPANHDEAFKMGQHAVVDVAALRIHYARQEIERSLTRRTARKLVRQDPAPASGYDMKSRRDYIKKLEQADVEAWRLFGKDGPYWNYLAGYIRRVFFYEAVSPFADDIVNDAIVKVARFLKTGHFKLRAEGKGYFRGFLKVVTFRVGLDYLKRTRRWGGLAQEQETETLPLVEPENELEELQRINVKMNEKKRPAPSRSRATADNLWDDPSEDSAKVSRELDACDRMCRSKTKAKASGHGKLPPPKGHLVSLDDLETSTSVEGAGRSPIDDASMLVWRKAISEGELRILQRVQINVLYIALGQILDDEKVPGSRREILRLLHVKCLSPGQIYQLPAFSSLKRGTFDKRVHDAQNVLKKKVKILWKLVMPEGEDVSEREVCMLWAALSNTAKSAKMVALLRKRAREPFEK